MIKLVFLKNSIYYEYQFINHGSSMKLKEGNKIIIAAHGNTVRAFSKVS